ncbi:MAG: SGNH/GDSL hydrolase family protein [Paludibacter sp.]|nr:SGNH/GDSL hydrolase family protein [Paludibacter sp.]
MATIGKKILQISFMLFILNSLVTAQQTSRNEYLKSVQLELQKTWPDNRTINIVFHGHSVPCGYFATPIVNTLSAYPHLTLINVKEIYPYAVVNVITTSIGGENAESGEKRFVQDVLSLKPDVLFIDYALNDRNIGLLRAEKAWRKMIEAALNVGCKVILLTPTPDLTEDILNEDAPLKAYALQIRNLASEYKVGLVDSYLTFKTLKQSGKNLSDYMAQNNHPNEHGHQLVADEIKKWFLLSTTEIPAL